MRKQDVLKVRPGTLTDAYDESQAIPEGTICEDPDKKQYIWLPGSKAQSYSRVPGAETVHPNQWGWFIYP